MVCRASWEKVPSPTLVPALTLDIYVSRELCGHDHATREGGWRSSYIISSSQNFSHRNSSVVYVDESEELLNGARVASDYGITYLFSSHGHDTVYMLPMRPE